MPTLLPGTLRLRSADGVALEVAAGTPLPVERASAHTVSFTAKEWSLSLDYRTAEGAPHERRLPLLLWDGSPVAGRALSISAWVSPHRAAFVEIGVDGGKELYRFDPIPLRDGMGKVAVAAAPPGSSVVERGFASAAKEPPPGFRIIAACDHCARSFPMRVHHAGHAGLDFFYCGKCPGVSAVPLTDPRSAGFWKGIESRRLDLVDEPHSTDPQVVKDNLTVYAAFEAALAPCGCGGRKRFLNDLLCPHCAKPWIDFQGDIWKRLSEVYLCHVAGHGYVSGDAAWKR